MVTLMHIRRAQLAGGFSMIEILFVLAIAGILVTLSFAYLLRSRPAALLHRAELQLSSDLGLSRDLAYNEEAPVRVVFDSATEEYWTERQDQATSAWEEAVPPKAMPETIDITEVSFPDEIVNFTPRGTLVIGGSITIANDSGGSVVLNGIIPTGRFPILGGALR
jgi:prepilin-type N-terminal cleavage/methylation domain-containing protein